ncbi:MAG: hypothetical protein DRJ03_03300 [Chloroflexi bacterium]|nr:MAG: hypothetical protein DRJ03_03300 [Chloroflexota bacterium]
MTDSEYSVEDVSRVELIEHYHVLKSRQSFHAFREYYLYPNFLQNWFVQELSEHFQQFYVSYLAGHRPVLVLSVPPQTGKTTTTELFIAWVSGLSPLTRLIYASYAKQLGTRTNHNLQRIFCSPKFQKVFPNFNFSSARGQKNLSFLQYYEDPGSFRNTTTGGGITGESLEIGIVDDCIKGYEAANSATIRDSVNNWLQTDFLTRFADTAGMIVIGTRWHIDDPIAFVIDKFSNQKAFKNVVYPAIATKDEKHRVKGEALFPQLKSLEFLLKWKEIFHPSNWEAVYQQSPVPDGGNIFKSEWWGWYKELREGDIKYRFIVADTAMKIKTFHDFSVFQCWAVGKDNKLYLLDMVRDRFEAPQLQEAITEFYDSWDIPKKREDSASMLGLFVEDKASGIGLIQHLQYEGRIPVFPIARSGPGSDKVTRAFDAAPKVKQGYVLLHEDVPYVDILIKEAANFPNDKYDDIIDTAMSAIEITYINQDAGAALLAAMED